MSEYIDLNLHEYTIPSKDSNVLTNELELFLQEIEIAIKMEPTDVYGHYGTFNLQNYVFSQFINETTIARELADYISENCWHSQFFEWNVNVNFETVSQHNQILIIKFDIYTNISGTEKISKIFKIET